MVFKRVELLQRLLDDNGVYVVGDAVDYKKGPFRAFRLQLLLVPADPIFLCEMI
jgi:hypothetical protein